MAFIFNILLQMEYNLYKCYGDVQQQAITFGFAMGL